MSFSQFQLCPPGSLAHLLPPPNPEDPSAPVVNSQEFTYCTPPDPPAHFDGKRCFFGFEITDALIENYTPEPEIKPRYPVPPQTLLLKKVSTACYWAGLEHCFTYSYGYTRRGAGGACAWNTEDKCDILALACRYEFGGMDPCADVDVVVSRLSKVLGKDVRPVWILA